MEEEDDLWKQFLERYDGGDGDVLSVPSQVFSDSYLIGFVNANIVGLCYYSGTINGQELVGLDREPLNPYDPNAFKVLNSSAVQVGHIERTVAVILALLLDLRIISAVEAIVPKPTPSGRSPYRIPYQIHIFALPDAIPTVQCGIEDGSHHLFTPNDHEFGLSESVILNESTYTNVSKERRRVNEIFALVVMEGKGIELLEPPKDVILMEFFPHQKEGLGWLVHRENSQDLPLFWKEKNGAFLNVLTNHLTNDRPEPLKGGIFDDDMGLGENLTLLSLIASNKLVSSVSYTLVDDVGSFSARKHKSGNKRVVSSRKKRKIDVNDYNGGILDRKDKVYLYHGERKKEVDFLLSHHIVLTIYKTLALEFSSSHSALKEIEWLRVILDEAHVIKNFLSQQTKAVVQLKAERRWVVIGTPIKNNSFDLYSLMAVLRFLPLSIKNYWHRLVQRPLDQGSASGIARLEALMASFSLRRMKGTHNGSNSLVGLPSRNVDTCFVELFSEEREQYEKMESVARSTLREYINADTILRYYSTVLHIILRLHQICNNVALCPSDLKSLITSNSFEGDNKMWDIAGDGFEPVDDMGILEVVNLSLDLL
ncbi:hypothetical protein KFK09_019537 [Dendrobium nobile]|uniref:Helicase ATP-binding domain-containing protein n=1 Tax=Dendrobium nobile TaxID=94219 RepID=A0A8T3AR84_DENNO|nr:hypothetical protein KFK09_019537 [Dendrobium nobile]